jgi:hypothetical protein
MVGDVTAKLTFKGGIGREGGAAIILKEDLHSLEDAISYLEHRIQVCWAGVVAEALDGHYAKVDNGEACRVAQWRQWSN